jgi:hypothetical protein
MGWVRHGAGFEQGVIDVEPAGRGQPHPWASWTEFEECMDMLARAGTIRSTGFTAAPFSCPREAAHACA